MQTRRQFLQTFGAGAIVLAACGGSSGGGTSLLLTTTTSAPPTDDTTTSTTAAEASTTTGTGAPSSTTTTTPDTTAPTGGLVWERVNLGFVSAYVLARGGEAAIVDTGIEGSEGSIELSLSMVGLGWADVGHVIVTHLHGDHAGSLPAVLELAPDAIAYAGAPDIPAIESPRPLTPVEDGDSVFDLRVIATPGHTAGHISVLDERNGVLVAGDAINGGPLSGPNPQFSSDIELANASVTTLAGFSYETILFGHGDPVLSGGSAEVRALAADL